MNEDTKQEQIDNARRFCDLLQNSKKEVRERCTTAAFLRIANIPFDESKLRSPQQADSVDVHYDDANFQVVDLLDGRRPRKEAKQEIEGEPAPFKFGQFEGWDRAIPRIAEDPPVKRKNTKYAPADRANIDLLVYHNTGFSYLTSEQSHATVPHPNAFTNSGWRSVCILYTDFCAIVHVSEESPGSLKERAFKTFSWADTEKCPNPFKITGYPSES